MTANNVSKATGCGYDKESTVIAAVFNTLCIGMATKKFKTAAGKRNAPYGVNNAWNGVYFSGGIGTSCYYQIVKWLGGKMEHTASTRNSDVYTITFKKKR